MPVFLGRTKTEPVISAAELPARDPQRGGFILLALFFGSGCAALIYEIVWFQLLQLAIGSTAVSLGVLLGAYMGGMCLGSLLLPRWISPRRHPLRVYALLELGIGLIGLLVLIGLPAIVPLYARSAGPGWPGIFLRGALSAVCLLPPTLLMGATLPAIARWVEATPKGVASLGFFYGANIAGAVFGCLLAGFYLLRVHDMPTATLVAASINGTVAFLGLGLATWLPNQMHALSSERGSPKPLETLEHAAALENRAPIAGSPPIHQSTTPPLHYSTHPFLIYVVIALSGLGALGAEVTWTRLLSLLLGGTVYTFSIILAVFLAGLGIGSGIGAAISRNARRPQWWLAACQALLAAAIAWCAYMMAKSLPYWPITPSTSPNPWHNFQLDLLRCLWVVFPAACLWGASFPLALATVAGSGPDLGRVVGKVYAANTLGAIIGAIGASIIFIGWIGTQQIQQWLIGISAMAALLALISQGRRVLASSHEPKASASSPIHQSINPSIQSPSTRFGDILAAAVIVAVAAWLAWTVPPVSKDLIAFGRYAASKSYEAKVIYHGEGLNSSVAVSELEGGVRQFHVSGKVEASSLPEDMRLQRMLGHLPALVHPNPRSVLIVGCGAGVTAGTFVVHPEIQRIVICEIEPLIPKVVAQYFAKQNHSVLEDDRVQVVYDDARHFILTTHETFDIITSDPIHPWVKGAATLYTREYFELCQKRLNPRGVITQWVPLYESSQEVVKSEIGTFLEVFPEGTMWSNETGGGYDLVLLGQMRPGKINVDTLQERLERAENWEVTQSLDEVGLRSAVELLGTYCGRGRDLRPWLKGAQINRDRNLRLQYLAGRALNIHQSDLIYEELVTYRKYPEELFTASTEKQQALKRLWEKAE